MPLLHLIIIAVIQGITELLPISSSAHLAIFPKITGSKDQGAIVDVAVHLGTLVAVICYFRNDSKKIFRGTVGLIRGKMLSKDSFLVMCLIIATIPACLIGLFLALTGFYDDLRNNVLLIGFAMVFFGLILWWIDRTSTTRKYAHEWTLKQALILGLWQAIALLPGTSRSGITITGARFLGYKREDSIKISMLMSIPVILAAAGIATQRAIEQADYLSLRDGFIAGVFSAISAFIALSIMMRWLEKVSFTPYVVYRIVIGMFLILWAYN